MSVSCSKTNNAPQASLTSELSLASNKLPFTSLEGLLDAPGFMLTTRPGGNLESIFRDAPAGSVRSALFEAKMAPHGEAAFPPDAKAAIKNLVDQEKDNRKVAHYTNLQVLANSLQSLCWQSSTCKVLLRSLRRWQRFRSFALVRS